MQYSINAVYTQTGTLKEKKAGAMPVEKTVILAIYRIVLIETYDTHNELFITPNTNDPVGLNERSVFHIQYLPAPVEMIKNLKHKYQTLNKETKEPCI